MRPVAGPQRGQRGPHDGGGAEQVDLHDAVPFGAGHLVHPAAGVGARRGDDGVEPFPGERAHGVLGRAGLGEVDDGGGRVGEGGHRVRARVDPVEQERCAARGRDRGGDGPAETRTRPR